MLELPILKDIIIIFGLSIAVLLFCHCFKIPSIVGFILTGVLCGPDGLRLVSDMTRVETLSQMGIVLLLFTIGMEFSLKKIFEFKRFFIIGGFLQVALTSLAGFLIAQYLQRPIGESIFFGFLLSLSSTAIILKILEEKIETSTPQGRVSIAILIFQDVIAVPMLLLIPLLAGVEKRVDFDFFKLMCEGFLLLLFVIFSAEYIVPKLLYYIARTKNRDLFLLTVLLICFSVAALTASLGLSLSIGAFLAGLLISESEYSSEAIGDILPFRDIFTSFFFVSIGMLLDISFVLQQPLKIMFMALGVLLLKSGIAGLSSILLGMPLRTAVLTGLALSQIGEFSFVLAKTGLDYHMGTIYNYQLFLAIALISMALTPWLMAWGPTIAHAFLTLPLPSKLKMGLSPIAVTGEHHRKDHVIIAGFGVSGRNLARSCRNANIPYIVLDLNTDIVRRERAKGEPIHFGDASHESVLHHAHIQTASALAVMINDPVAALRVVRCGRKINQSLYIIARTRHIQEVFAMYDLGADDVIPDEFGTSVEIFTHVLKRLHVPPEDIDRFVYDLRLENEEMLRHIILKTE